MTEQNPPLVLELRVHGVNNTTAATLLDLRPEDVEFVMGDTLGSFWRPSEAALAKIPPGARGYVPDGIRREAYSWGGMVRTTPDLGGTSALGTISSIAARIGYALLLPFSIANVAQWAWKLPPESSTERGFRMRAGLTRTFGLLLTLLFTCTAITVFLDLGAAQCAAAASVCGPAQGFFQMFATWTAGQRLALFALGPVVAAGALWALSTLSRQRYDVLPGMAGHKSRPHEETPEPMPPAPALLASRGFWSNRVTRTLAHAHFASAIFLTTALAAGQAAFCWRTRCVGLGGFDVCIGDAWTHPDFDAFVALSALALLGLIATVVVTFALPTTAVLPPELQAGGKPRRWTVRWSNGMLAASATLFLIVEGFLLSVPGGPTTPTRLYGVGATPLVIVSMAAVIVVLAVFWRPRAGRTAAAWHGCGPAAFLLFALVIASSSSAIVAVTIGDWLNGSAPASTLVRGAVAHLGPHPGLTISSSYVAIGVTIALGAVILAVVAGVILAVPRDVTTRARRWGEPTTPDEITLPGGTSVLPPSPSVLMDWIRARRAMAVRVHLAEPLGAAAIIILGIALSVGIAWAWISYGNGSRPLWDAVDGGTGAVAIARSTLNLAIGALGWIGIGLVAVIAAGASRNTARPAAIVWDIICYLPRAGHPFGPPAYAERAVPEIAGRLYEWLGKDENRRAVLVGHSMGCMLVVSALGLLASDESTRGVLPRISLITFGAQLRAFFGRMFPELVGPEILGTAPSRAPRVTGRDPWSADLAQTGIVDTANGKLSGSLLGDHGVPWRSLWRPTDMLGFVVNTPTPNSVDVPAEEIDLSGYMADVGGHSGYGRVPAYDRVLRDLGGLPPARSDDTPPSSRL